MSDVNNLLNLAIDSNPVSFADQLNDILQAKAVEAIEAKRIEVAKAMYSGPNDDDDDLSLDDDDDDNDLDLDDLDLDDLDLEELDDNEE